MAAAAVDTGRIAGHLGLAESAVNTITTDPTPELVASFLQALVAKADEFDEVYNAKLMLEVELESAHRNAEERCRNAKATADKALKDVEEIRQKLHEEETKRQNVENELQSLKSRESDHDSEITTLRDRIESLQSSNRANMALLESRNARDSELSDELAKQHQKNVQLNKEITSLQTSLQAAQATASSAKYREDSVQQQLDLARRNSEWFENELKTKSEEALKYRKEKGARIAELQRQNEDAKSETDALKRSEQQLRDRLDAAQAKAEEALTKLQQQQEAFARTEESYKHELESKQRLVDMANQLTNNHKTRVQQLEGERESLNQKHVNDIKRLQQQLEQEKENCRILEERVGQLEGEIDELQVRMEQAPQPASAPSAPSTPRPNGSLAVRAASPFATPGSVRSRTAITATQAIEELYKVKGQLAGEKRRNQQLAEELDNMIAVLEAKTPEIEELQAETDALRAEITKMSQLSEQSYEERDAAKKSARKAESALSTTKAEAQILRNQLRDLSTQIQMLVFNMHAREKGLEQLTREETLRLEQLSRGEVTENALSDMSDTNQFITQKFVVFRDIQELQEKNQELLRVTRDLADKMENEEARAAKDQAAHDSKLVDELKTQLANLMDERQSLRTTTESFKTERDMFRRLLQQKNGSGELDSILGSPINDGQRHPLVSIEDEQGDSVSPQVALRDLQAQFDSYRDDAEAVRQSLRDQVDKVSGEKNALQAEVAKISSQLTLATERYEMLHSNFVALQTDNKELQKRSQVLSEGAAKQDIRTQQVAEELIEARGLVESMRNETANLKAEKKLWKDIQDRLNQDNESLVQEKARLNGLLATHQSLQNERDISESEARRKSQSRIESLESELSDTKRKLSEEVEEGKKLQLRKEFDAREAQKRIDELSGNLSQIREEHVAVKTSRDHLQARVDELTIELRSAEERYGRLQPRPTPRPGSFAAETTQPDHDNESEVRELINEVADLKRDLELARAHLENAKEQAEQYKNLSEENEKALSEFTDSQEQFQHEIETTLQAKDAKIKELEQRVEDVSAELANSNKELSALRDAQGEQEITTGIQKDYEHELMKHAEAAQQAQQLRAEYNQLKSQTATLRAEAESAKVTLAQSQGSWEDRRQHLEQEIAELKARRDDANAQNKLLHQQLESVTAQFSALKQNRTSTIDNADSAEGGGSSDNAIDGLRELNSYLQREKDILEVQYDLKVQESKRLQQQLTYSQSQLEETRLKLDQERRTAAESGQSSLAHKDLMEKINELNLYRESSATLRNELTQSRAQIAEKNAKIEELEGKVQPLEAKIEEIETQKGFLEEEIKQIQEDRDRWQKRTEGMFTKYGRVDPAEMDQLKQTVTDLEAERDALKEAEAPLRSQLDEIQKTLDGERSNWQNTRQKLTEQFKERSKKLSGDKNEAIAERNNIQAQLDAVKSELEQVKNELGASSTQDEQVRQLQEQLNAANNEVQRIQQELEASSSQKSQYEQQISSFQQQVQLLQQEAQANQSTPTQPSAANTDPSGSASADVVAQLEQNLANLRNELENMTAQKQSATQELESLRSELQSAVLARDEAQRKASELAQQQSQTADASQASAEPGGVAAQTVHNALSDEERKALEDKIVAAEAKAAEYETKASECEAKMKAIEESQNQTLKERSDKMKNALNDRLRQDRQKLEQEFQTRVDQEKIIWQAEHQAAAPSQEQPIASTPVKKQEPEPTSNTPTANAPLSDGEVRKLLATNPTAKSIFTANLKKKLEEHSAKAETTLKAEYESKISTAREEGQALAQKKSALQINMRDNQVRAANAKLEVVSTAAANTPARPVGEVWEEAKVAKPAPAPAAQPTPARAPANAQINNTPRVASGSPAPAPATAPANSSATPSKPPPAPVPATGQKPVTAAASGIPQPPGQKAAAATTGEAPTTTPAAANPFAASGNASSLPANPFANAAAANTTAATTGGFAGRGRGRGGHQQGGALNPGANDFQPGTKRPRGDGEAGGGAKRARGSH
ncbi:6-phosphofructokinase [Verticillium dahliae VDG1]|nr:6-phosphofructokinase [Verticillium dahliae VDG1]